MGETCDSCGNINRAGVRFCTGCGAPVDQPCTGCGSPIQPGERFCGQCGTAVGALAPPAPVTAVVPTPRPAQGERKQVTVLFADVANSMEVAEEVGAEGLSQVMGGLFEVCKDAVVAFGGTVDKFTGDGVMALFGAPLAQEDHAQRACRAGLRLIARATGYAAELNDQRGITLEVRVGLNSGEVVAGSVGTEGAGTAFTAVGHTVGLAQRMESLAQPGMVYLSEHTAALVAEAFVLRPLGKTEVKGAAVPIEVFALEGITAGTSASRRRTGSTRMVGRDLELATLEGALNDAREARAQVIGIVGDAGAGKSRLCEELAQQAAAAGVTVRTTAGVSHAQAVPLLPILGFFRGYFGIGPDDSPARIRETVGARLLSLDPELEADLGLWFDFLEVPDPARPAPRLGPNARRRRVLDVLRRITARRSERGALLLIFEDLQWFDPESIEFLDGLMPSFPGTRTLVVTNFRPEFHPPWATHSYYRQLPLSPLPDGAVLALLDELLGPDPSLAPVIEALRMRVGGNPFFAEEIVRGLAGDGTLVGDAGAYTLALPAAEVRVPPTVQAVLAARMDRICAADKMVLQAAAVIGRTFSESTLAAVLEIDAEALADSLQALQSAELLQETGTGAEYRFWHPLTQEVAYGTLLGSVRRRLHQRVANALIAAEPARRDELAPLLATHFEAAEDELETGRWRLRAGTQAFRISYGEAMRSIRLAIEHLDAAPESAETLALRVRSRTVLLRAGARTGMDSAEADRIVAAARPAVEKVGDPALTGDLAVADGSVRFFSGDPAGAQIVWIRAVEHGKASAEPGLHAWACVITAITHVYTGPLPAGMAYVEQGIELCGDDPTTHMAKSGYSVYDLGHMTHAYLCLAAGQLEKARQQLRVTAAYYDLRPVADFRSWTLALFAHLADCTGEATDAEEAGRVVGEALQLAADSGSISAQVTALQGAGVAALLTRRPGAALDNFRAGLEMARRHGSGRLEEATLLANLARAQMALGQPKEARAAADEAVEVAQRQYARVAEVIAHLARARVWRTTAVDADDLDVARAAVVAGEALAEEIGAATQVAFLCEERARLEADPTDRTGILREAADRFAEVGATGHARRLRAELDAGCN